MSATVKLLDRALRMCAPATDYQLAKRLGIKATTIYRCRNRGGTLDNMAAWKLAEMLQMEPAEVIAYMEADRAKTDQQRSFWSAQLPRALPLIAIASVGLLTLGGSLIGGSTEATHHSANFGTIYLMLNYNIRAI